MKQLKTWDIKMSNNEKQLAKLIDERRITFKNLSWPVKTVVVTVWFWLALAMLSFLIGFLS